MVILNSVGLFLEGTFVPLMRFVDNALAVTDQSVHTCERFTNCRRKHRNRSRRRYGDVPIIRNDLPKTALISEAFEMFAFEGTLTRQRHNRRPEN
jgi:hypothetical protein